jgi:hypothetical protein
VGLAVLRLIVGHLVPIGAPLVIAVDDTLFRRCGRRVHAAYWGLRRLVEGGQRQPETVARQHVRGRGGRGHAAVSGPARRAAGPDPAVCKGGPAKTVLARELVEVIAAAARGRMVHVVADGAYLCTELRRLPPQVTLTGPLRSNSGLWQVHPDLDNPPRLRGRGRPRVYAARIGTSDQFAATVPATPVAVTRYRRTTTVQVHYQRCLWRGVFGARPVRVLVITEPGKPDLALVTTDLTTPVAGIVERYAGRWAIEVAFEEAKQITGVGEARNRTR